MTRTQQYDSNPRGIRVLSPEDPRGDKWHALRVYLQEWVCLLPDLKALADGSHAIAVQRKRQFDRTSKFDPTSFLCAHRFKMARAKAERHDTNYKHCCDAINGAKALLDEVGVVGE